MRQSDRADRHREVGAPLGDRFERITLLRVSVGLEDAADLERALTAALDAASTAAPACDSSPIRSGIPYSLRFPRFAPNVFVVTQSAPAAR